MPVSDDHVPVPSSESFAPDLSVLVSNAEEASAIVEDELPSLSKLGRLPGWLPPLFYLLLALIFLWRSTFTGEVFLPATLLSHVAPYSVNAHSETLPPWNPLRWDGIAQFYPWRHFAAETIRSGRLPLWNPYQFCGTPFVANSQSAVFYPGNLLFYLLPTAQAFHASALLHLTLCGWFLYLLLRRLHCSEGAALLGGVVYAYSAWQVAWLQLPTFLATSCWFPLLLRQVLDLKSGGQNDGEIAPPALPLLRAASLAAVVGLMLLAGHLQIAFYGLLAGILLAFARLWEEGRQAGAGVAIRLLSAYVGALVVGMMLAMPQVLPALELSRFSHRAGKATAAGYAAYTEYALPPAGLTQLTLPDFFGNDYDPANPYWGFYRKSLDNGQTFAIRHNAAETALYVGIVPLLLAFLSLLRTRQQNPWDRRALFFGGLALMALLMALGTPINALFYFLVPGFGQSGSPARSLVLWALAVAVLSALGLDALQRRLPTKREQAITGAALLFTFAIGLSLAASALGTRLLGFDALKVPTLAEAFQHLTWDWLRLLVMSVGGLLLLLPPLRRRQRNGVLLLVPTALLLTLFDLFSVGIPMNPTAPSAAVYPETSGIRFVRDRLGHERVFPINKKWSLFKAPPAVLPPNGAMAYGFRDVQGYDSLLTGQYKQFANQFALPDPSGQTDASPPEVGNMVFFQNPNAPDIPLLGAAFFLSPPALIASAQGYPPDALPSGNPTYSADNEMAVTPVPNALPRARLSNGQAVAYAEDTATRVVLTLPSDAGGSLLLDDQFYPGWHAYADDRPVPILRQPQATVFRAVTVPAGTHVIAFRYEPASFHVGLYLACFALCLLCLPLGSLIRRKER